MCWALGVSILSLLPWINIMTFCIAKAFSVYYCVFDFPYSSTPHQQWQWTTNNETHFTQTIYSRTQKHALNARWACEIICETKTIRILLIANTLYGTRYKEIFAQLDIAHSNMRDVCWQWKGKLRKTKKIFREWECWIQLFVMFWKQYPTLAIERCSEAISIHVEPIIRKKRRRKK